MQKIIKKIFFAWKFGNAPAAEPEIFAGKFVDNSWLAELNKAKNGFVKDGSNLRSPQNSEKVLEMPPAADPEISQAELATGTHDNLPTQIQPTKITIAEADSTATAKQNHSIKGRCPKIRKGAKYVK